MNILIYRYGSICEPAFIDAFRRAGLNVIEDKTEITQKNLPPTSMVKRVKNILDNNKCLFVFSINFYPTLSAVCNIYKIPYVCVIVDSPVYELYSNELKNPCNRIFLFDSDLYKIFSPENPDNIFYMPLCADTRLFSGVIQNSSSKSLYACDISMVGSLYSEKCKYNTLTHLSEYSKGYIDGIIEAQIDIYGYNFIYEILNDDIVSRIISEEDLGIFPENSRADYKALVADDLIGVKVSEQDRIRTLRYLSETCNFPINLYTGSDTSMLPHVRNCGLAKSLTEMPLIFNVSKINLNITARTIHTGIPQRVFDVLACGGFLITNYQTDLDMFFTPGKELEIYTCKEELADKIRFYLEHDTERMQIARCGYENVTKYHNMDVRFREMLDKVM